MYNFLDSAEGKAMQEVFDIRFICHEGYHSYLSGFVESKVKMIRFFSTFNTTLTYNELICVLTSIAKVINCRPIGLYRQPIANDTESSCVTSFSLMY